MRRSLRRTFFRPERPTLTSRSLQSITRPFQKRFREVFGNARILIFYVSIKAWEEISLPKTQLGWSFLVFGEGKATKENISIFWFIWPLNEKNSCTPINPKGYSCYGLKKKSYKKFDNEKNSCGLKIPTLSISFLMVRPLLGKTYKQAHSSATLESLKSTPSTKLLELLTWAAHIFHRRLWQG